VSLAPVLGSPEDAELGESVVGGEAGAVTAAGALVEAPEEAEEPLPVEPAAAEPLPAEPPPPTDPLPFEPLFPDPLLLPVEPPLFEPVPEPEPEPDSDPGVEGLLVVGDVVLPAGTLTFTGPTEASTEGVLEAPDFEPEPTEISISDRPRGPRDFPCDEGVVVRGVEIRDAGETVGDLPRGGATGTPARGACDVPAPGVCTGTELGPLPPPVAGAPPGTARGGGIAGAPREGAPRDSDDCGDGCGCGCADDGDGDGDGIAEPDPRAQAGRCANPGGGAISPHSHTAHSTTAIEPAAIRLVPARRPGKWRSTTDTGPTLLGAA
jgi:hypothetical protein